MIAGCVIMQYLVLNQVQSGEVSHTTHLLCSASSWDRGLMGILSGRTEPSCSCLSSCLIHCHFPGPPCYWSGTGTEVDPARSQRQGEDQ